MDAQIAYRRQEAAGNMKEHEDKRSQESRQAPAVREAARQLEMELAQFALRVGRMCKKLEMESGAGRVVSERVVYSSAQAAELVQAAFAAKNEARTKKLLGEALQHVDKVVHWLDQLERSGKLAQEAAVACRRAGSSMALDLVKLISTDLGKSPPKPGGLGGELSDL